MNRSSKAVDRAPLSVCILAAYIFWGAVIRRHPFFERAAQNDKGLQLTNEISEDIMNEKNCDICHE